MTTGARSAVEESWSEVPALQATQRSTAHAPSRRFYRPELDMIRFFAFLAVFVHHGIYVFLPVASRIGAYGLSLFFCLSAFLITELLQREKLSTGRVAIREFYIRRCLRIWPLYYGFLLFICAVGVVFPSHRVPLGFLATFALMIGNTYIARHGFLHNPSAVLWSISVEEQFYLFWPLMNRHCSRRTLARITLLAFPIGSIAVLLLSARHATATVGIWCNTFVQLQMFAFGVLLALALKGAIPNISPVRRASLFVAGSALWFTAAQWTGVNLPENQSAVGPLIGYYLVGLGCVALLLSIYGMNARHVPAPLVYLGKISFGLYVFHQFCLEVSSWAFNHLNSTNSQTHHVRYGIGHLFVGFLLTVAAAVLSYRYFEKPFLKLKESFAVIQSRAA